MRGWSKLVKATERRHSEQGMSQLELVGEPNEFYVDSDESEDSDEESTESEEESGHSNEDSEPGESGLD